MTDEAKTILALGASLIGLWVLYELRPISAPITPKFAAKDCFVDVVATHNEPRPPVDGIVEGHEDGLYWVLYYAEANRNSGGAKDGWKLPMADFDQAHDKVPCPASWTSQAGKKP